MLLSVLVALVIACVYVRGAVGTADAENSSVQRTQLSVQINIHRTTILCVVWRQFRATVSKWEVVIKVDAEGIGWECVDWINLAQDRNKWRAVVNVVMNFRFP
jgi:hypothetical protein